MTPEDLKNLTNDELKIRFFDLMKQGQFMIAQSQEINYYMEMIDREITERENSQEASANAGAEQPETNSTQTE